MRHRLKKKLRLSIYSKWQDQCPNTLASAGLKQKPRVRGLAREGGGNIGRGMILPQTLNLSILDSFFI